MTATYIALASLTLTSTDSEIVFSSIPATYRDLVLVFQGSANTSANQGGVRFNSDTGSNYTSVVMAGNTTPPFTQASTFSYVNFTQAFAVVSGANNQVIMQVMDYAQTNKHKSVLVRSIVENTVPMASAARWANTNAINTLTVTPIPNPTFTSFTIGSTFSLYGIN